ncbi:hypothetical protein BGZ46_001634 [Entomortierella lignicola]|nr:hypothetical protein BGZ46_001634 [Entomortierella lignicola]
MTSSPSGSPWKSYRSSALSGSNNSLGNTYDDQDFDENGPGEHERLLARRRSTSYYDANRSRAPVAVVIKHDSKGRPISTWSTASSVAAQRGEELSQWSKRRDDLIKIYGRSNLNSSSFANDDLEEEPEQEREQEQEEEEHHSNQGQGQWLDPVLASDQTTSTLIKSKARSILMKIDYFAKVGAAFSAIFSDSGKATVGELAPVKSVAIIGAGAGGSSTAYYLSKYLDSPQLSLKHPHSITIFEQSNKIGGRCSAFRVQNPGEEDKIIEVGASIFVRVNYNLVNAAKEFGLKIKPLDGEKTAIWNGKEFVFEESQWNFLSVYRVVRRWGYAPFRLRRLLKSTVDDLLKSYSSPEAFHSIFEFAQRFKLDKIASSFSHHFLQNNGIHDQYSAEVVEVATRVNYGSNLHEIHALGALVTMAAENAVQIQGGNFQIFEGMVGRSKANVKLGTGITRIRRLESKKAGIEPRFEVTTSTGHKEVFDTIVIAAPIQSTGINFDFDVPPVPEVKYRTIHATFVRGHVNPAYFHAPSAKDFPAHILTTNAVDAEFTSLSIQTKLSNGETITKIFSATPIEEELLDRLYSNRTWVKSKVWKAYPHLEPLPSNDVRNSSSAQQEEVVITDLQEQRQPLFGTDWGKIEVVPGIFYVNAFEPLISTMETETIAGKNVARLVRDRILGYCAVEKIKF